MFLSRREDAKLGLPRALRRSSPPGRYALLLMAGCQDTEYSYDAWFQSRPNGAFTEGVGLGRQKCQKRGLPGVFLDEPADPFLA